MRNPSLRNRTVGFALSDKLLPMLQHLETKVDRLKALLDGGSKKVVILAHTNPDGDAIGSSLAWAHVLKTKGHEVVCMVPNRFPSFLNWMPGIGNILIYKENERQAIKAIESAEIIFFLDFNRIDRLEALGEAIEKNCLAKRVLIDHHLDPPDIFDLQISYPDACSTSYLVYLVAERYAGLNSINTDSAVSMYVGIMTDTGNFSFSTLTPDLFRAVAELVEKGIDIPYINAQVYNAYSEGRVRLLGYVLLDKMKIIESGQAAYVGLEERELRRFDFQIGDSEGFVNFPLTINGIKMSAMFLQTRDCIRVSLRSRGDLDVNVFAARYFEGGGHKNASGGKSADSMEVTIKRFEAAANEYLAEYNSMERLK